MNPTDPRYLTGQYASGDNLAIIAETHWRYGMASEDVFSVVTRALFRERPQPRTIPDIGAGTGEWYASIRRLGGDEPQYMALDQSTGMVEHLQSRFGTDARAQALQADAQSLPFPDAVFDWVGMHFVLYFLPNMRAGLQEAWRVVSPGGILACVTNGRRPHYELWDLQEEAARRMGLPGAAQSVTASDRFHLDNGAELLPEPPTVHRWPAGLRFDEADAVVRYLAAGPIRKHLGDHADDPAVRNAALEWIRGQVDRIISRHGVFAVQSEVGCYLARRP